METQPTKVKRGKTKQGNHVVVHMPNQPQPITNELSPEVLIARAIDKGLDVSTMERLMSMRKDLRAERAKEEFDKAMADFQAECPVITKGKVVKDKHGVERYRYAPLGDIVSQVKDLISKNGLSYKFDEQKDDKYITAICLVTHVSGHTEQSSFKIEIGTEEFMTNVQKYGARMTFAKRYAFCNAFGILTGDEDTDGAETDEPRQPVSTQSAPVKTGGINEGQMATVRDLVEQLGGTMEELEGQIIKIQKKSITDMTMEQGKKLIETLRKRLAMKNEHTKPVTDEDVVEIEKLMEKTDDKPDTGAPQKRCPFCDKWHTDDFPKCKECWQREQNGEKLTPKGKTKTITNPDEPPFESKARPGETIH